MHFALAPGYFGICMGFFTGANFIIDNSLMNMNYNSFILLIFAGFFAWLNQCLMVKSIQLEKPSKLAILQYLQIVYIFLFDIFYFKAEISIPNIIGSMMIIGGNISVSIYSLIKKK